MKIKGTIKYKKQKIRDSRVSHYVHPGVDCRHKPTKAKCRWNKAGKVSKYELTLGLMELEDTGFIMEYEYQPSGCDFCCGGWMTKEDERRAIKHYNEWVARRRFEKRLF